MHKLFLVLALGVFVFNLEAFAVSELDDSDIIPIQYTEKLTVNNIRIGHPITILLYESNLNLDSDKTESYSLDLILFESKNVKTTLGAKASQFNAKPSVLRETGDNTGIFYSVIEIPPVLDGKRINAGEKISFEYTQRGYGAFLVVQNGEYSPNKVSTPIPAEKKQTITPEPAKSQCKKNYELVTKALDGSHACVRPQTKEKLIARGWANLNTPPQGIAPLQVLVKGDSQVRIGTTHNIEIQVKRGDYPIQGARVFIDIEDYGEDIIREYKGFTNSAGYFVFSWEIPKSFDDVETLFAIIDVTDNISAKTVKFKFQVYCLPEESGCVAEGN